MALVNLSAISAIVGSVVGIFGLLLSSSKDVIRRYQGLVIESAGLTLSLCGPLAFFVTVGYLTIHLQEPQLHVVAAVTYALCAVIISRIVVVRRSFGREV